jgi:hypothetical protein
MQVLIDHPLSLRGRLRLLLASWFAFRATLLMLHELPLHRRLRVAWRLYDVRNVLRVLAFGRTGSFPRVGPARSE